ncbi:MAG: nicotinate (nicotinamide) nucleotide adenylyltransferase [Bacteroidales bacterium]|jgi:nicotinate-nucleotide adenylyltransferase|nr:nicotinate (nicotinamide) nucleotide adenylyltransferase [Bacteroidales bacterium]
MILLFFGSFNPVHDGHIAVARVALKTIGAEELCFVLSGQSPFKKESDLWDYQKRLDLLEDKLQNEQGMSVCTLERDMPKPSYTIDTLNLIEKNNPQKEFYILMGQDNFEQITLWKNYEEILRRFPVVVYPREGGRTVYLENVPPLPSYSRITFLDAELLDYSSTKIRNFTL